MESQPQPQPQRQPPRKIRIVIAVNESTIPKQDAGPYKPATISSIFAFDWVLRKIVRSNYSAFQIIFLTVLVAHERDKSVRQETSVEEQARAMEMLLFFTDKCCDLELACEVMIEKGDPKNVICREARRVSPDLLVLGSRGVNRFLVPSVSHHVRTNYGRPVLVIKRTADVTPRNRAHD
ncbi:Universal stress protein A-like protein [Linum grandiflorum]